MWADRTNCYVRSEDITHWENPSEWKRGCGAIWWLDMWYSAMRIILFDCRAYFWVMQNVIPDWRRFQKWECGLYLLCGVLGGCGSMGGLIEYVGLWDLYCDLKWCNTAIWFLSGVRCMVVWFGWSGLTLYSLGYIWVDCGNVFFCGCQSGSYAEHFFWYMLLVVYGSLIVWSIGLVWALLLIYPSILVWYRWVGVLLIFAPFRFCRKGWMWFNCTLTGKIARYDMIYPKISESTTDFAYCNQEKHML